MLSVGDMDVTRSRQGDHYNERTDEYGELGVAFDALLPHPKAGRHGTEAGRRRFNGQF